MRERQLGTTRLHLLLMIATVGFLAVFLAPASASAAGCTDTWTGGATGSWFVASNWSAGRVPLEFDVACIGSGHVVEAGAGSLVASSVKGEGGLYLPDGSLDLVGGSEVSTIGSLTATLGATVTGPGTLQITRSLVVRNDSRWQGPGSIIVAPGATAELDPSPYMNLEGRRFVNEGTTTLNTPDGGIEVNEATEILNTGTFVIAQTDELSLFEEYEEGGIFVNRGTVKKTGGTGVDYFWINFRNEGTVNTQVGTLSFGPGSASPGSRWEAATGAKNGFSNGAFAFRGTVAGDIAVERRTTAVAEVTMEKVTGSIPHLTLGEGTLSLEEVVTVGSFKQTSGIFKGVGTLKVSGSMALENEPMWQGPGSVVLLPGSSARIYPLIYVRLEGRRLVNEGSTTLEVPEGGSILMNENAEVVNRGIFTIERSENTASAIEVYDEGGTFVNRGTFQKTAGAGTTPIGAPFENFGTIKEPSGHLKFLNLVQFSASAATPNHACAGEPVDCGTGNFFESQTDLAIGGRGVGLDLTRSYSAQAAAAGATGIFGPGWTNSFGATLSAEEGDAKVTLTDASGATVSFTRSGTTYVAPGWSRDKLVGSPAAGFTLTLPDQTKEKFTGPGRLESVADRNGNTTKLTYNGTGNLEKITDPSGRSITLAYNAEGLVEKATDPMAHVVRYTYESGDLKTVTLPGATAPNWSFEYDGSNRMTSIVDGRAGKTTNEYGELNRVVSQTDPAKRTTTWRYEGFHTTITAKATGAVTSEWFNSYNQPISITHGYGTSLASTESFTYTEGGLPASRTDGAGHTTTYGYDAEGNRTSERDAEGDEAKWTFNGTHQLLTTTSPRGEKTTIERDAAGNPKTISRPAPESKTQTVSYIYGTHGEVESTTDPLGNKWTYGYDAYGDRTSETDPLGDKRTWVYNADSRVMSTVAPRGNETGAEVSKFTTSIERDAQGRPIKIADPLGGSTKYSYDADGDVESITDPKARKTKFVYDADHERIKVERPDGSVEETGYDGLGRVTSQTDGKKNKTIYVRNILEQPVQIIDPLERKTVQTFDGAGNLKTRVDPEGRTTTYVYDKVDRPKEVTYSAEAAKKASYAYDLDGDLTKMVDATGESTYEYDQLDRLTHSKNGFGETSTWRYNLAEEPIGLTYPNGRSITRAYDKAGRLESVTDWLAHKTSFSYNRDSRPTTTTFPTTTGDVDEYAYDRADRMSGVTMKKGTATLASLAYVRDAAGLLESLTSKGLPGAESEVFGYDANERLTKAGSSSYEYDAADNPVKAPGTLNAFDKAGELESATGSTFGYDKEGDRTKRTPLSGQATTYRYDQAGRLTAAERALEGKTPAIAESFDYDGLGLLAARTVAGTTRHLVWDPTESPQPLLYDGEYSYIYGPGGLPLEQISTGEVPTYLHHDQLGSTRLITNAVGEAVGTSTYGPYGGSTGSTGTVTTTLGYAGQYTLGQSGLQYLRARFYDPATAEFLTRDGAAALTGRPYGYADDDPLSYDDPIGYAAVPVVGDACLDPELTLGCVAAGVGVATVGAIEGHGSIDDLLGALAGDADESAEDAELEALARDEERYNEHVSEEACQIAKGHAFGKHGPEFGVQTEDELEEIIEDTIKGATHSTDLENGRSAYYDEETNTLVITNPNDPDGGTVYKPENGLEEFDALK